MLGETSIQEGLLTLNKKILEQVGVAQVRKEFIKGE